LRQGFPDGNAHAVGVRFPARYGRYETYQTSLREIEALSGLSFGALMDLDPFRIVDEAPPVPVTSFEQIRFA
jgi:hypothetical protein